MKMLLVASFLSAICFNTSAADFSYGSFDASVDGKSDAVIIRGEIKKGDYERLKSFIRPDPQRFLEKGIALASSGGDIMEAIRIGNLIRSTYQLVFVNPAVGRCASACFLIYVAAVDRNAIVLSLGIHRPYFSSEEFSRLSLADAEKHQIRLIQKVRSYLEENEVPSYLIEKMFSLSSDEIYWLNGQDLDRLGLRANWWDQILVNRCNLDKRLERGFLKGGNSPQFTVRAMQHLRDIGACGYRISITESENNLAKLLRSAQ
ncbi:MAG: hypothetical protein HY661_07435 [Betaproteobacteria bacterium]|nr:hypothetical protein [Betaproteobacteria bacterium]